MKLKHIARVLMISVIAFLVVEFVPFQSFGKGTVYDSVVGAKYRVVRVDGSPPERLKHGFIISIVPLVVIEAGAHEIELKREKEHFDSSEETESFLIQSEIESGERYKIIEVDGKPQIINKDEMYANRALSPFSGIFATPSIWSYIQTHLSTPFALRASVAIVLHDIKKNGRSHPDHPVRFPTSWILLLHGEGCPEGHKSRSSLD